MINILRIVLIVIFAVNCAVNFGEALSDKSFGDGFAHLTGMAIDAATIWFLVHFPVPVV